MCLIIGGGVSSVAGKIGRSPPESALCGRRCSVGCQRMGDLSPPRAGRAVSAARRGRWNGLAAHWQSSPAASPATSCPRSSCHHLSHCHSIVWLKQAAQAPGQVWTQIAILSDQATTGGKNPPRDPGGEGFARQGRFNPDFRWWL